MKHHIHLPRNIPQLGSTLVELMVAIAILSIM